MEIVECSETQCCNRQYFCLFYYESRLGEFRFKKREDYEFKRKNCRFVNSDEDSFEDYMFIPPKLRYYKHLLVKRISEMGKACPRCVDNVDIQLYTTRWYYNREQIYDMEEPIEPECE